VGQAVVAGDGEQPPGEPGGVLQPVQLLEGFEKGVLANVQRIFAVPCQAEGVVEEPLLPSAHQEIEGAGVTASRSCYQVLVGQSYQLQVSSSQRRDERRRQKV
jgi:hypothetical protein